MSPWADIILVKVKCAILFFSVFLQKFLKESHCEQAIDDIKNFSCNNNMTTSYGPMISVVDDDAFMRQATENLLLSWGFVVSTFASAEAFLDSGRADDTSCLITDVHMPGLTGLDLQQRLIEAGKRLPIIFITAFFSEKIRKQALDAGAIGFLSKPFGDLSLLECLNRVFDGPGCRSLPLT